MLLERLVLKNFLIFEDVDLDLKEVKLASIIGQFVGDARRSNGAGKTAFMEAIRYALFDQTRSKAKAGIVRTGSDKCHVEIEFYAEPCHIRVVRDRSAGGTSSAKVWVDGKLSGDKVKGVNQVIIERLGMDAELFDLIYFFKQGDQFGFAEASPGDRKAVLAKVFRMDTLAKCQILVKDKLTTARETLQRAKGAHEAALSRLSGMWSMQQYGEQELTASHNLACLEQIHADLGVLQQEATESVVQFEKDRGDWHREVDDKRNEVNRLDGVISQCSDTIAGNQQQRQQQESEVTQLEQQLERLDAEAAQPASDEQAMAARNSELAMAIVENTMGAKAARKAAQEMAKDDYTEMAGTECPTCHQVVGVDHVERMAADNNQRVRKELEKAIAFDKKLAAAQSEQTGCDAEVAKWAAYHGATRERLSLQNAIKQAKKNLRLIDESIDDLVRRRSEAQEAHADASRAIDISVVDATKKQLAQRYSEREAVATGHRQRVSEVFNESQIAAHQHSCAAKDLENRRQADTEEQNAANEVERADKEVRILTALSEAFGKNGIQALIIENALGVVEQFANEILKQMQTRFVVELRTQKQTKAGEDRESLDVIVFDNGNERAFENYSGGERTLVNLALRLSLSRVISSLHGVKMQSLFLDEVFGALDEVNREEVVKVIAFLSRSFEQVLVVSHTDEIRSIIDSGIVIRRHDHHSTVELTNGGIEEHAA